MQREYELVLMLDPQAPDAARGSLADDARSRIEAAGELVKADEWGIRKMAYEIDQRGEADYRYFRFKGGNDLLEALDKSLKIAEGVLRFRIFKVNPDTPTTAPPASDRPDMVAADRGESDERGGRRQADRVS